MSRIIDFLREYNIIDQEEDLKIKTHEGEEVSLVELLTEFTNQNPSEFNNNDLVRVMADFDNYKKRTAKEKADLSQSVKIKTLDVLLDIDNELNIALKSVNDQNAKEGIELIIRKLSPFLEKEGITEVELGLYNSDIHEAIALIESDRPSGEIIDVVSKGYRIRDKIIRFPKVVVSK